MKTLTFLLLAFLLKLSVGASADLSVVDWNNRGGVLYAAAHYPEAEKSFKKALELESKEQFVDPGVLASIQINLAAVYRAEARYSEAEPLYLKALSDREAIVGHNHPDLINALRGLSLLYLNQGKLLKAEESSRRGLGIQKTNLGKAQSMNDLAAILFAQGRFDEAEKLAEDILLLLPATPSQTSFEFGNALNMLGRTNFAAKKYAIAEKRFREAALFFEKIGAPDNLAAAAAWMNVGRARAAQGDWREATGLMERSLRTMKRSYGTDNHPDIAAGLTNLAAIFEKRKNYGKAKSLFERALEIDTKVSGSASVQIATDLNNLGSLAFLQHHYRKAESLFSRGLDIDERMLGAEHPDTGLLLGNLARAYFSQGRFAEAEPLLQRATKIRERAFGSEDPILGNLLEEYATVLRADQNYSEAAKTEVRATRIEVENALRAQTMLK